MQIDHQVTSVDGAHRVAIFRREDGTYGYLEFQNTGSAESPHWRESSRGHSRFGSGTSAMKEAKGRIAWLGREVDWPAKDFDPLEGEQYIQGWVECPRCHIRFSLTDKDRWGYGRHLTCGQRILVKG
jgi:hypothetical protein